MQITGYLKFYNPLDCTLSARVGGGKGGEIKVLSLSAVVDWTSFLRKVNAVDTVNS